jgi:hypothetical protein
MNKIIKTAVMILCIFTLNIVAYARVSDEERAYILHYLDGKIDISEEEVIKLEDEGHDIGDIAIAAQLAKKYEKDEEVLLKQIEEAKDENDVKLIVILLEEEKGRKYYVSGEDTLKLIENGMSFTELRLLQTYILINECTLEEALIDKGEGTCKEMLDKYYMETGTVSEKVEIPEGIVEKVSEEYIQMPVEDWMMDLFKNGFCLFEVVQLANFNYTYEYVKSGITLDKIIDTYIATGSFWLAREELNKLVDPTVGTFMDSINKN